METERQTEAQQSVSLQDKILSRTKRFMQNKESIRLPLSNANNTFKLPFFRGHLLPITIVSFLLLFIFTCFISHSHLCISDSELFQNHTHQGPENEVQKQKLAVDLAFICQRIGIRSKGLSLKASVRGRNLELSENFQLTPAEAEEK